VSFHFVSTIIASSVKVFIWIVSLNYPEFLLKHSFYKPMANAPSIRVFIMTWSCTNK